MSKRVSNKPNRTGARTFRTHRVYRARVSRAKAIRRERAIQTLRAENESYMRRERERVSKLPPPRVSLLGKARAFVGRIFTGGRP